MSSGVTALTRDLTDIRQTLEEWLSCDSGALAEPLPGVSGDLAVILNTLGWDDDGEAP
jgi:hypothetical protein